MNKKQIETIILQDAEIKRLKERDKKLEKAYLETIRDNIKLRQKIKELEHQCCELNKVNV
jgi:FtsZ-binding cell division protein ZapB